MDVLGVANRPAEVPVADAGLAHHVRDERRRPGPARVVAVQVLVGAVLPILSDLLVIARFGLPVAPADGLPVAILVMAAEVTPVLHCGRQDAVDRARPGAEQLGLRTHRARQVWQ